MNKQTIIEILNKNSAVYIPDPLKEIIAGEIIDANDAERVIARVDSTVTRSAENSEKRRANRRQTAIFILAALAFLASTACLVLLLTNYRP